MNSLILLELMPFFLDWGYAVHERHLFPSPGQLTGIKASASFRPDTPDGQTEVRFEFDATAYKGHDLVVFETMRIGETTVDEHKDPEDEKQTVHVPEIGTKAGKPKGKKVVDKVSYSNLIPEQAYIVTGWLVDKKTGKKIKGSDGKTGFVPKQPPEA